MKDKKTKNKKFEQLKIESLERLKELSTINRTTAIMKEGKAVNETLQKVAYILPDGWQFPEFTKARIIYGRNEYLSNEFKTTGWKLSQDFTTIDNTKGSIEIYYTKSFPNADEGPFLKEERDLITNLTNIISGYLNSDKGKEALRRYGYPDLEEIEPSQKDH